MKMFLEFYIMSKNNIYIYIYIYIQALYVPTIRDIDAGRNATGRKGQDI